MFYHDCVNAVILIEHMCVCVCVSRMQRKALWFRGNVSARRYRPLERRMCVQEDCVYVCCGPRVRLGLLHLLQRVRAGEGSVHHSETHQGDAQGLVW